jgi:hypothetical protein
MTLQPWYKVAMPREDLRKGQPLDASEFAIHLDQVIEGRAPRDYKEPERFFARTFITKGLETLVVQVMRRLAGEQVGSSPGVNLTTQFGGGKTHALVLLYHLAKYGEKSHSWPRISDLLTKAELTKVPKARVAAFVGNRFDFVRGSGKEGEPRRKTPWADIAWQLGGAEAYTQVEEHDRQGIVPGGEVLEGILSGSPLLILMDEVLNYIRRTRDAGGDYARVGSQMYSFLEVLSREAIGRNGLVLCVSLPMSEYEMTQDDIAEFQRLSKLMNRLSQPAILSEGLEIAEIIRRRLFEEFGDRKEIRRTARDYAKWLIEHRQQLPEWFPVDNAAQVFEAAYPFHPVALSAFERKWQGLPRFQLTRGALRMLALWVSRLYQESFMAGHKDPVIGLGTAPLSDGYFRAEVFEQLGERLEEAVLADIAGEEAWAVRLDSGAPDTIGRARLHQKVATAVFFESSGGQLRKEATLPEVRLAIGEPGLDIGNVETVLEDLIRSCYYLSAEGTRYRFSRAPNLNKLLADRRATVSQLRVEERVREAIRKVFDAGPKTFERRYFPIDSGIPDTPALALVIMPPEQTWEPTTREATSQKIATYIQECSVRGRTFKSALLFAVAYADHQLTDDAKSLLALESLEDEITQLPLDEVELRRLAKQLAELKGRASRDLTEHVWQAYRYVILLDESGNLKEVDLGPLHSSAGESLAGLIQARLKQEGLLEESVTPDFLVRNWPPALAEWSTKGMRDVFYASPQFPRLTDSQVLRKTIADGVKRGKFGYASKNPDGSYQLVLIEEPSFGEADVEFSDQVVLLPRETALALKEGRQPVRVGEGRESEPVREAGKATPSGVTVQPATERVSVISWRGEVPWRQWMQFYTKVLSRLPTQEGLHLEVNFKASPPEGVSKDKVEETKTALRELGLDDKVSVDE